jgi:hypothetical protein
VWSLWLEVSVYIRCATCTRSARFKLNPGASKGRCSFCASSYSLVGLADLGDNQEKHGQRVEQYAEENQIDPASAYSVLLGIMTLERAREIVLTPAEPANHAPDDRPAKALGGGQSAQAGDKEQSGPGGVGLGRVLMVLGLVSIPLLGAAVYLAQRDVALDSTPDGASVAIHRTQENSPPSIRVSREVRTNPEGAITLLRAASPGAVLDAYCLPPRNGHRRQPVEVLPLEENCLGVFREGGTLYGLMIRKDPVSGEWVAGDGLEPLVAAKVSDMSRSQTAAAQAPSGPGR